MKRFTPDPADQRYIRRLVILIVMVAVLVALYRSAHIWMLAFGAILGAIVIRSVSDAFVRILGFSPRWALWSGMTSVLAFIIFLGWLFAVQFGSQINAFIASLPQLIGELDQQISVSPVGAKLTDAIEAAYAGSRIASDVGGLVSGSAELLLNILLIVVGSFFLAADPTRYEHGLLLLLPKTRRPVFSRALDQTASTLKSWVLAQVILMTTMGILVGVGLWLAGVPSAPALGLLAGLSEFIPYVGPTVAMLPALGLAATTGHHQVLGTIATYLFVRLRIPKEAGRGFRFDVGHHSDLKPATYSD